MIAVPRGGRRARRQPPPAGYHAAPPLPPPPVPLKERRWPVLQAPEMRLLRAWIEACQADSVWAAMAQFESAWLAELDAEAGHGTPADQYLPADVDPALRQLFALPPGKAIDELLGWRDEAGAWHPGWAELTEREFEAMDLWLEPVEERDDLGQVLIRPREPWEIAREMAPRRARRFGQLWIDVESVERYLREGRRKLRILFGVDREAS